MKILRLRRTNGPKEKRCIFIGGSHESLCGSGPWTYETGFREAIEFPDEWAVCYTCKQTDHALKEEMVKLTGAQTVCMDCYTATMRSGGAVRVCGRHK